MNIKNSFLVAGLLVVGQTVFGHSAEIADRIAKECESLKNNLVHLNLTEEEKQPLKRDFNKFESSFEMQVCNILGKKYLGPITEEEELSLEIFYAEFVPVYMNECLKMYSQESCKKYRQAHLYLLKLQALQSAELLNTLGLSTIFEEFS